MALTVLATGCIVTPWFFGGNLPQVELLLACGVPVGLLCGLLWLLVGKQGTRLPAWPVWLVLAGVLLGTLQRWPLSPQTLKTISPASWRMWLELDGGPPTPADDVASPQTPGDKRPAVSLYPASTRRVVSALAVALGVFWLSSVLLARPRVAGWFLLLVALNGMLIALFGLAQQLRWNGRIYWLFPLPPDGGVPFGPFINRNNAGGYLNVCLACALAVLYLVWGRGRGEAAMAGRLTVGEQLVELFGNLNARKLLALTMVIFTMAGILSSLSRGATLAMLAATLVVIVPLLRRRSALFWFLLTVLVAGGGLLAWLDRLDPIHERLSTAKDPEAAIAGRLGHWQDALKLAPDFWLTGTGLGTYRFVYRTQQQRPIEAWFYHAENQYVESLVELGAVGLALLIIVIGSVVVASVRLLCRSEPLDRAVGTAGLFAVASQIVAGSFDFGLYLPANMFLMAAVCGAVVGCSRRQQPAVTGRRRWLAVALSVVLCLAAIGGSLAGAKDRLAQCAMRRLEQLTADVPPGAEVDDQRLAKASALLQQAARWSPDDADIQSRQAELSILQFRKLATDRMLQRNAVLANREEAWKLTTLDLLHRLIRRLEQQGARDQAEQLRSSQAIRQYLVPARQLLLRSRRCCPLLATVHLRLAQLDPIVSEGEEEARHLRRAVTVYPSWDDLVFSAGMLALDSGDLPAAVRYWRHTLELGSQFERQIIMAAAGRLSTEQLVNQLVPDDPETLLRIATRYFASSSGDEVRRQLLERAASALEHATLPPPARLHLRGQIRHQLGRVAEAARDYAQALRLDPQQLTWRVEYAELLRQQGKLDEAIKQYLICQVQAGNGKAYERQIHQLRRQRAEQRRKQLEGGPPPAK